MSLPGAPAGKITITKDTLGILEKLLVFDSDDSPRSVLQSEHQSVSHSLSLSRILSLSPT